MGETDSLWSLTLLCAPVGGSGLVQVSYRLPAIPADLSLPVSTRALLPIKQLLKRHSKALGVSLLPLSSQQPQLLVCLAEREPGSRFLCAKLNPNSKNVQVSSEPGSGLTGAWQEGHAGDQGNAGSEGGCWWWMGWEAMGSLSRHPSRLLGGGGTSQPGSSPQGRAGKELLAWSPAQALRRLRYR